MIKISLAVAVIAVLVLFSFNRKVRIRKPKELNPQYDYIIVGGGTAGCVLASRLSEDPDVSVLLLEAGGEETELFYSHIPGATPFLQQTDFDWQFFTVPQSDCCSTLKDNQARLPRGKVLGGSSVLSFMHYVRGNRLDFDRWRSLGNDEWSYENVLPYFKKAENILIERFKTSQFHGTDGPLDITEGQSTVLGKAFVEAGHYLGLQFVDDYNGAQQEGFSRVQLMINKGKRISAASAYLRPVMHRSNLHVVTRAFVTKVIFNFNDEERRAVGVEYEYKNTKHRVLTNREVLLTSGAIGSPHILFHSGIGSKDYLKMFAIHVVQDLPAVGKNLKDQLGLFLRFSANESIGMDLENTVTLSGQIKALIQYAVFGSGPLSWSPIEFTGFLKSNISHDNELPSLQFYLLPGDPYMDQFVDLPNFDSQTVKALHAYPSGGYSFAMSAMLLHAQSSGEIKLQSTDPTVPPLIDPKYFRESIDFDVLFEGVRLLDRLIAAPSMRKYDVTYNEGILESCASSSTPGWSEDYLKCLTRNRSISIFHPVGTCRMGAAPSVDNVVDQELRVHGVKGLRVIDASIFPTQTSGNPLSVVIMIAEKASHIIKATKYV